MTVAEQDKEIIKKLPSFTKAEIEDVKKDLTDYLAERTHIDHLMLLSNEIRYFTIFKREVIALKTNKGRADELFNFLTKDVFLKTLGELKVLKRTGEGEIEIWIGETPFVLFEADSFFVPI